eukprot:2925581-Pyramimonas_sp.AAC.1
MFVVCPSHHSSPPRSLASPSPYYHPHPSVPHQLRTRSFELRELQEGHHPAVLQPLVGVAL